MSENINLDDIKKLSEEVNSLVQSGVIPLNDGTKKVVDKFNNLADAVSKVDMQNLGKSTKKVAEALDDVTDATKDLIEKEEKLANEFGLLTGGALKKFGSELLDASGEFLSAMNSASTGFGKYSRSVEHIGKATKELASHFGTYGEMAGWTAEKMAEWAATSLKQNDELAKSFQNLAKFGQIDTTDFRKMLDQFHQAGFGLADVQTYLQAVNKSSSELANFGNTAAQGRKAFDGLLSEVVLNEEERTRFMRMGYSVQDIIENSASVMSSVSLSARGMKMDTAALHKITGEYLETQAELNSLTGGNRDDLMKARRAQEEDVGFQMYLAELPEAQAEQARNLAAAYGKEFGKDMQTAVQQLLRTGGNVYGQFASTLYKTIGPDKTQQILAASQATGENRNKLIIDSMQGTAKAVLETGKMFSTNIQASKTGTMPGLMQTADIYKGAVKAINFDSKYLEEFAKMLAERPDDDRVKKLSELYSRELEFKQVTDKATYAMGEVAVKAITGLAGAADSATTALSKLSDKLGVSNNWKPNSTSGGKTANTGSNRTSGTAPATASGQTASASALEGLNVKPGAHTREQLDSKLVEIMHKVSKEIPGFNRITSINDRTDPYSKHSSGKAFDMTLKDASPENLDAAIKVLRSHGLYVKDEYRFPTDKTTGPHLHAGLQGRTGGIFSGPKTGYQVELHGKEAVIPMSKYNSMFGDKNKGDDSVTKHQLANPGTAVSSAMTHSDSGILKQLMGILVGRLDDMIYELQSANSASAKIAKNSKKK